MPRIKNIAEYVDMHRNIKARVSTYLEMNKSNYQRLDPDTKAQLDRSQERYFHANNFESRIRFTKMVFDHLAAYVDGAIRPIDLLFATLIPDDFAVPESEAQNFDVGTVQQWALGALEGFNFVGIVEAALFPKWPHGQPTISWHVHGLLLGAQRRRLERQLELVKAHHRTLVDGVSAAYVEGLSREQLEEKVCYLCKSPLTTYQPNPQTVSHIDQETGEITRLQTGRWNISKPLLRTGEHVRMCRVMANQQLDKLIFGVGDGAEIVAEIRRRAFPQEWSE